MDHCLYRHYLESAVSGPTWIRLYRALPGVGCIGNYLESAVSGHTWSQSALTGPTVPRVGCIGPYMGRLYPPYLESAVSGTTWSRLYPPYME